jgi:hypothetical protein
MDIRGCAHVGLESRSPFLDHRIVEFAFRLPGRMKIRAGGLIKWILREVAREFLPADLVDRSDKTGPCGCRVSCGGGVKGSSNRFSSASSGSRSRCPEDNDYDRRLHALVSRDLWLRTFHDKRG